MSSVNQLRIPTYKSHLPTRPNAVTSQRPLVTGLSTNVDKLSALGPPPTTGAPQAAPRFLSMVQPRHEAAAGKKPVSRPAASVVAPPAQGSPSVPYKPYYSKTKKKPVAPQPEEEKKGEDMTSHRLMSEAMKMDPKSSSANVAMHFSKSFSPHM